MAIHQISGAFVLGELLDVQLPDKLMVFVNKRGGSAVSNIVGMVLPLITVLSSLSSVLTIGIPKRRVQVFLESVPALHSLPARLIRSKRGHHLSSSSPKQTHSKAHLGLVRSKGPWVNAKLVLALPKESCQIRLVLNLHPEKVIGFSIFSAGRQSLV